MGCAPQGPAGTGKTETTKDLAAMMAVCIYVFNCAPEMDYRSMGDIWKGLGASGGLNPMHSNITMSESLHFRIAT
jgi:dynein heavy chain